MKLVTTDYEVAHIIVHFAKLGMKMKEKLRRKKKKKKTIYNKNLFTVSQFENIRLVSHVLS